MYCGESTWNLYVATLDVPTSDFINKNLIKIANMPSENYRD